MVVGIVLRDDRTVHTALLNHIDLLAKLPSIGAPVRGYENVRELLHSPFKIYYRVNSARGLVKVLCVWHHKRQVPRIVMTSMSLYRLSRPLFSEVLSYVRRGTSKYARG